MAADAEMCMLAADTMEALGIKRESYLVKINNRKILDGIMETVGVGGVENANRRLTVLRAIDKLDRLGEQSVRQLLGPGRKDESGDFTSGAGLEPKQIDAIFFVAGSAVQSWLPVGEPKLATSDEFIISPTEFQQMFGNQAQSPSGPVYFSNDRLLDKWAELLQPSPIGSEGVGELRQIIKLVRNAGYGSKRIRIGSDVVRGLEYYTGPVYEVDLPIQIKDSNGRITRFGSVGGGGRYDGLVSRFMGQPVPATGFSIGVSRLQAALTALGKPGERPPAGPVLVTVFGAESVPASQQLTAKLRAAGIRAELYLGNPKHGIGQQLKYADRRGAPCAVIQGPDEKAKGDVLIRDLIAGAAPVDVKERDAYLKKQAEAQVAVKEAGLVEAVRQLLARHGL
jgi:histidyl-tRNA synthetase